MNNYIVSKIDGTPLINTFQNKHEESEIAAVTAALSGLSKGLKNGLDIGSLNTIIINGSNARYAMRYIDEGHVLGVLSPVSTPEKQLMDDVENITTAMTNNRHLS
ncbi:MAG: roadblock/LC7 domain-containing protein [Cocleimonas sp.]|nr:roadblock/LC7 domain-containing protein [Cocleimonas sp.]